MFKITDEAARTLDRQYVVREIDRAGYPHLLIKVPSLETAENADIGLEVRRDEDGCVVITILFYDIPTEPVSYEMRFYPDQPDELGFLYSFVRAAQFRLHPCARTGDGWEVAKSQSYRVPANVLLRLKHFSLEWPEPPTEEEPPERVAAPPAAERARSQARAEPAFELTQEPFNASPAAPGPSYPEGSTAEELEETLERLKPSGRANSKPDPRDTVIKKLKEQNHALRDQIRKKDKRIIELEDDLAEVKSRGRAFKFGDKKNWWKPF